MSFSFRLLLVLSLMVAICLPTHAQYSDPGPIGLPSMERFDLLPYLWNGVQSRSASSFDRFDDNIDRSNYVYQNDYEHTLMDVKGPGCVYRIWITSLDTGHVVRFYLDNDTTPRYSASIRDLFSGSYWPFLSPLVCYSSGGYNCYLPIPFKNRCRIAVSRNNNTWFYYNIQYHKYPSADGVTTWTKYEDSTAVRNMWNSGSNPNTAPDANVVSGATDLARGATKTLALLDGPASVKSFAINIPQIVPHCDSCDTVLRELRLKVYWDGESKPSIDVPVGEFFGCGLGEYDVNSLPIKMSTTNGISYKCYFPMPFGSSAKIELTNDSSYDLYDIDYEFRLAAMPNAAQLLADGKIGYFHAVSNKQWPSKDGEDYMILQTAGKGCFVGCVVTIRGTAQYGEEYLEGDERIHIDGNLTPYIYGTGTEDFFNGGWYFKNGDINLQTHGNRQEVRWENLYDNGCYRYFMSDKILYYGSLKIGLEHGNINDINANYSSVAYYYEVGPSALELSDEFDVGDSADETKHNYSCTGETWSGEKTSRYPGDCTDSYTDNGREFQGECSFTLSINPENEGVKIRRRMNHAKAHQDGLVYVDGSFVGHWYDAGSVPRWFDSDIDIPKSLTQGKSSINVRIVSNNWSEYRYRAYSYVANDTKAPSAVSGLRALGMNGSIHLSWTAPAEPDVKGVIIRYSESNFPSSPTDGSLLCDVPVWAESTGSFIHTSLINDKTYYYSVYAYDGAGHYSPVVKAASSPQTPSCFLAKVMPENEYIQLHNKVVTGIFSDEGSVYVSDENGISGIRVRASDPGLALGDRVDVSGTVKTYKPDGTTPAEREIVGTIYRVSSGTPIKPRAMSCLAVGGGGVEPYLAPVMEGNGEVGVGLDIRGNLVKLTGKVTKIISYCIYMDDGSDIQDIVEGSDYRKGVFVRFPSAPNVSVGDTVSVIGVVQGSVPVNWTASRRAIRCRTMSDLIKY